MGLKECRAGKMACHLQSDLRRQIENDAALDFALDDNERGDAFAAIRFFIHREVDDFRRRLQRFRKNSVRSVDEGLNELHSHERLSPASAMGAPTAVGSSLST